MAIDTSRKRWSMLSFGRAGYTLPVADGSFSAGDRAHLLGLYYGLALAAPIVPSQGCLHIDNALRYELMAIDAARYGVSLTNAPRYDVSLQDESC